MAKLSNDQIVEYAHRYMLWALDQAEEDRLTYDGKRSQRAIEMVQEGWSVYQDRWIDHFEDQDWDAVLPIVQQFAEAEGLDLDLDQVSLRKLCRSIMRVEIERCNIERSREAGNYDDPYAGHVAARPQISSIVGVADPATSTTGPPPESPLDGDAAIPFSEVVDAYISAQQITWNPRTKKDVVPILRLLVDVVGDIPIGEINKAHVRRFDEVVRKLPKRRTVMKAYKGKTISQLMDMDIPPKDLLQARTIKQYFVYAKALLTWASRNYDGLSPFLGDLLSVTISTEPEEERNPFTQDDLEAIFYSPEYTEGDFNKVWKFWLPLIVTSSLQTVPMKSRGFWHNGLL